ncbi:hypothetical protein POSPLADRAFT_1043898 [Postia placenta MAD-698-R-SB12]|uniref:Release factor glutamine methyltransferase N-terminal domain-containing protein n=1 Tax=Postia placenta MAD-698-R-SB12 TaxID=670580 RepID=A0A1X6ND71_9APHY|nr:hypothetical protein POSPLADRAFT_1043898 [Postia placenta MAD-698-R-SB12]OSX66470.1 hypothetical protein POSPLADRAFT_1043898 [Postia placenta MAD-698-R-SB12]
MTLRPTVASLVRTLQRVLGQDSAALELKWMKQALDAPAPAPTTLEEMLARRVAGEPLQYILGTQPFGPLNLLVRPPVLIPRPETEDWALRLAERLAPSRDRPLTVLDLCTGSGCIPLLLCHLAPPGALCATGVDVSENAIQLASDNAALCRIAVSENGAPTEPRRNTFTPVLANIRDPAFAISSRLRPPYDVVTSNPPYISKRDYDQLPASVKDYEDPRALLGDLNGSTKGQGLDFYHTISDLLSKKSQPLLKEDGLVALEVGETQAKDVAELLDQKAHIRNVEIWQDPWGKDRVVVGKYQIYA